MKFLIFSLIWLLSPFSIISAQMNPSSYQIRQSVNGEAITIERLAVLCAEADVVFWGEEHNDSLGHALQAELFALLFEQKKQDLALSLEMFESDVQLVLDEYLAGFIPESRFLRDARPWDTYNEFYRPMVEMAKTYQLPVIAANAPRRYVSMVSAAGKSSLDALPKSSRQFLPPLPYDTLEGPYRKKFEKVMSGHGSSLSSQIYHSQNLWDASMAWQISRFRKKHKKSLIYHLCGRFHSDERLGTVSHLHALQPKIRIITISCFPTEETQDKPQADLADFVITHP